MSWANGRGGPGERARIARMVARVCGTGRSGLRALPVLTGRARTPTKELIRESKRAGARANVGSVILSADSNQRSAGWYVGALVFWLLTAWLIAVGLGSLIPQIFGPAAPTAVSGTSCTQDLHDLARELLDRVGAHVKDAPRGEARDTLETFF